MQLESPVIERPIDETTDFCETSGDLPARDGRPAMHLVVVALAAASALTGALAAAWYYKKTLARLQQAELEGHNSKFGIDDLREDEEL